MNAVVFLSFTVLRFNDVFLNNIVLLRSTRLITFLFIGFFFCISYHLVGSIFLELKRKMFLQFLSYVKNSKVLFTLPLVYNTNLTAPNFFHIFISSRQLVQDIKHNGRAEHGEAGINYHETSQPSIHPASQGVSASSRAAPTSHITEGTSPPPQPTCLACLPP